MGETHEILEVLLILILFHRWICLGHDSHVRHLSGESQAPITPDGEPDFGYLCQLFHVPLHHPSYIPIQPYY